MNRIAFTLPALSKLTALAAKPPSIASIRGLDWHLNDEPCKEEGYSIHLAHAAATVIGQACGGKAMNFFRQMGRSLGM